MVNKETIDCVVKERACFDCGNDLSPSAPFTLVSKLFVTR